MTVTAYWYNTGVKHFVNGDIDWDAAGTAIKCSLMGTAYTPNQDSDEYWSTLTANEVPNGSGYASRGSVIGPGTVSVDTASRETRLKSTVNPAWASASFTARYAVIWKDTGTDATSPVIAYVDFGAAETVSSGTFTVTWDATGIAKITPADAV